MQLENRQILDSYDSRIAVGRCLDILQQVPRRLRWISID
eukprot:COSAG01_NODE_2505_length_7553_cov_11.744030_3_plen_39_part_00